MTLTKEALLKELEAIDDKNVLSVSTYQDGEIKRHGVLDGDMGVAVFVLVANAQAGKTCRRSVLDNGNIAYEQETSRTRERYIVLRVVVKGRKQ